MKHFYFLMITLLMGLSANAQKTGTCGPDLDWELTDDGVLTITGTGEMDNYTGGIAGKPWSYKNVKQVIIDDGVTTIGNFAFSGCTALTSINIPNSVKTIGDWAFSTCKALTSINIPNSVKTIRENTFSYCTALTSINIPNSVRTIRMNAFSYCTALTSINIPNSVKIIGDYAFSGCTALTSINIPNSVKTIGVRAFSTCTALTSINIPNSVTTIEKGAFSYCYKLKQIDIPNSVTTLSKDLLSDCRALESIRIHKDVVKIEEAAFDGCSNLTNISCEATTPPTCGTNAFKYVNKSKCKLLVPQASIDAYKVADEWKYFSYIEATTDITNNVYNKTELVDVYTIDGTKRLSKASKEEMNTLPKGVYIVNGKKFVIK